MPNLILNKLLQHYCEAALSIDGSTSAIGAQRSDAIVPLLPHGEATIENVAKVLGITPRTLARRLARERVSFLDVLQHLRLRLAKQYFHEPNMSISQAAWLLGYAGPSAFSHAFKRWTGSLQGNYGRGSTYPNVYYFLGVRLLQLFGLNKQLSS